MTRNPPRSHRLFDLIGLATVMAVTLAVTLDQLTQLDIRFGDETIYLEAGLNPGSLQPLARSSALYTAFYRALSFFEHDAERMYFLSWVTLTVALPVLLYALARKAGAPTWAAVLAATVWACSGAVIVWPFVSKLATAVIAVGAIVALSRRDTFTRLGVLTVTVVAAGYARPELVTAGWMMAAGCVVYGALTARRSPRRLVAAGAIALSTLGLALSFGTPFVDNRSFEAFEQHFALNVADARELHDEDAEPLDPWNDPSSTVASAFGDTQSVGGALRANPRAFAWHVSRNVKNLPNAVAEVVKPIPTLAPPLKRLSEVAIFALAALGIGGLVTRARRGRIRASLWPPLLGVIGVSALAAALTVYPRAHYLIPTCFLVLTGAAVACGELRRAWSLDSRVAPALAFATLLMTGQSFAPKPSDARVQEGRATIAALRELDIPHGTTFLEADIGRGAYVGRSNVSIGPWEKQDESLFEFMERRGVDVAVIDARLRADPRFAEELADIEDLEEAADEEGYELIEVPGTSTVLLVREIDA